VSKELSKYQKPEIIIPKCEIKKTGLIFDENLTFSEWSDIGKVLNQAEGSIQWWIGDWLNYGEFKWGEQYKEAEEVTGFVYDYLRHLRKVSKAVQFGRRRPNLLWAHHQEVAPFEPAEQDYWLDSAEKKEWTSKDLRREIRESKIETADPLPESEGFVYQKDAIDFLSDLDNQSVDLLLTDPPYMTDLEDIEIFVISWLPLALSKIKKTGRAYIFTGAYPKEIHSYLTVLLKQSDLILDNILVWTYRNTMGPSPKMGYKLNWQACFYLYGQDAVKLKSPRLVEQFTVQDYSQPFGIKEPRYSSWQKPHELAEIFIRHSTKKKDLIIDPFTGTGTFLIESLKMGRRAIGAEIDLKMIKICKKRGLAIK